MRVAQAFLATAIGAPLRMDTTVSNDGTSTANLTVVITLSATGALPHYLEATSTSGAWSCSPYAAVPASPISYTCTGTLAAATAGVITVSSGSKISGTPGQALVAGAVVNPGGVAGGATAAFA